MNIVNKWQGYRTIAFNVIAGALLLARAFVTEYELPTPDAVMAILDSFAANAEAILVSGNALLRFFTKTPVGKKEGE